MTREEAEKFSPIIQAYIEGKTIQQKRQVGYEDEWFDVNHLLWNENPSNYRIKPESTYRPFKNQEECWNEMLKHQPFGWIIDNYCATHNNITVVHDEKIELTPYFTYDGENIQAVVLYKDLFKRYKFADGTPFGVKDK